MEQAPEKEIIKRRVYLRLPVRGKALLYSENNLPVAQVDIQEISTTGLSFICAAADTVPPVFILTFLSRFLFKGLTIKAELKNRIEKNNQVYIGCRFLQISEEDKDWIAQYICREVSLSVPSLFIKTASIICMLDALVRIAAFQLYYEAASFDYPVGLLFNQHAYVVGLVLYLICSCAAFVFSTPLYAEKDRAGFFVSVVFFAVAVSFIAIRSIIYLMDFHALPLPVFVLGYFAFAAFAIYAVFMASFSFKKATTALDILNTYSQRFNQSSADAK